MLERLIYVSLASPDIASRDAYDIIRTAHNRNSELDLTGILLFADGYFVQVLEGHGAALQARFKAIAADPRHSEVDVRQRGRIARRCFPNEWMALRESDAIGDGVKQRFDYAPGLPADRFPPRRVLAFVRACHEQASDRTR